MQPCATKVPSEMQPCAPDDITNSFFRQFHSAEITDNSNNSFFRQFNNAEITVPNYASIHDASVVTTPTESPQKTTKIPQNHRTAFTTVLCNTRLHLTHASVPQNAKTAIITVFCNTRLHSTRAKTRLNTCADRHVGPAPKI